MKISRMTDKGIERFTIFLDSLKSDFPQDFPSEILDIGEYAELIGGDATWLDEINIENRFEAAKALDQIVSNLELVSAERDKGFWTWCSAYLFNRLSPRTIGGKFGARELAVWIPQTDNWRRYYRHYLVSIWRVYYAHRNNQEYLVALLNGPVNIPGELWGQIAAYQELVTNPSMMEALYMLFWDKSKNARKKGAGGKGPRRLVDVLKQFEKTWDFFAMSGQQIISLLPIEFDRFKNSSTN